MSRSGRAGGLLAALARRERLVGTFVTTSDLACAEMLAGAFDLLVRDLEHSAMGVGAWVLARVPSSTSEVPL